MGDIVDLNMTKRFITRSMACGACLKTFSQAYPVGAVTVQCPHCETLLEVVDEAVAFELLLPTGRAQAVYSQQLYQLGCKECDDHKEFRVVSNGGIMCVDCGTFMDMVWVPGVWMEVDDDSPPTG